MGGDVSRRRLQANQEHVDTMPWMPCRQPSATMGIQWMDYKHYCTIITFANAIMPSSNISNLVHILGSNVRYNITVVIDLKISWGVVFLLRGGHRPLLRKRGISSRPHALVPEVLQQNRGEQGDE